MDKREVELTSSKLELKSNSVSGQILNDIFVLVVLLILFIVLGHPIAMVGVGERGVKVTLGKVADESYSEGVHLIKPFVSQMRIMNIKPQESVGVVLVSTNSLEKAKVHYVINYNLQPDNAHKMYKELGITYKDAILTPTVEKVINDVISKCSAKDLVENREETTNIILNKLVIKLRDNYIDVNSFKITKVD